MQRKRQRGGKSNHDLLKTLLISPNTSSYDLSTILLSTRFEIPFLSVGEPCSVGASYWALPNELHCRLAPVRRSAETESQDVTNPTPETSKDDATRKTNAEGSRELLAPALQCQHHRFSWC